MKSHIFYRGLFYLLGLLALALGLTLNTKAGLGVSAIISVSYSISLISGVSFGDVTLWLYAVFVLIEMLLHLIHTKKQEKESDAALVNANRRSRKLILFMDVLQIPLSIIFTRFLNVFSAVIPDLPTEGTGTAALMAARLAVLLLAITLTGIGAAMSLNMRIIPNPGDGIVQAIADCIHRNVGFTKNCFDVVNITISVIIGFVFAGRLEGVGIGTLFAVIGVGRVIAVFNHFTQEKTVRLAGVEV